MDEPVVDDAALLKPKPKREKTDKQKEVWEKAQQTRLANAQLKKDAFILSDEEKIKKIMMATDQILARKI